MSKKVTELRKSGNVVAAYNMAIENLREMPDDIWSKRDVAWCIYELLKDNATVENKDDFYNKLIELKDLDLPKEGNEMLFDSIVWPLHSLIKNFNDKKWSDNDYFYKLFDVIKQFPFAIPSENYSLLLNFFADSLNIWTGFVDFCDWWDLKNLRQDDYNKDKLPNGKEIMSLAERVYLKYSKDMLFRLQKGLSTKEQVLLYIGKLSVLIEQHSDYQYNLYYKAKLLLAIGENDNVTSLLRPFVKNKQNDFWVWQILGDASTDEDMRFSCYCKAVLCKSKEEMIVKLREGIVDMLVKRHFYDEAKFQVDKIIETRKANEWKSSSELLSYTAQDWYKYANINNVKPNFFKDNSLLAESFLFGDMLQMAIIVTNVNPDKYIINFITEDKKVGFMSYRRLLKKIPNKDEVLICKMEYVSDKEFSTAYTIEKTTDSKYVDKFLKKSHGELRINDKGFGFIDNEIYVHPSLLKNYSDGDLIQYTAIMAYDKKKNNVGWRAKEII